VLTLTFFCICIYKWYLDQDIHENDCLRFGTDAYHEGNILGPSLAGLLTSCYTSPVTDNNLDSVLIGTKRFHQQQFADMRKEEVHNRQSVKRCFNYNRGNGICTQLLTSAYITARSSHFLEDNITLREWQELQENNCIAEIPRSGEGSVFVRYLYERDSTVAKSVASRDSCVEFGC
jgi:hypothetical protein